jgi:hypothetical protein
MLLTSSRMSGGLAAIFLLIFLYWQVVPVLMAASGASLDLGKLQAYPIPVSQLFGLEVMLRVTAAIEAILILAGAGIGILRNPTLRPWYALGLVPFAAFNLVLGVGTRDTIARILARRRIREAAFFLLILCAALPQVLFTRGRGFQDRIRALMTRESWPGWPWTATADFLQGHGSLRSLAILVAWLAAAGLFSYWQFRRTISFDMQAASARPSLPFAFHAAGRSSRRADGKGSALPDSLTPLPPGVPHGIHLRPAGLAAGGPGPAGNLAIVPQHELPHRG